MPELLTRPKDEDVEKKLKSSDNLRRLIKIFRSNTVVKHHFQSPRSEKPIGVAKAFFKSGYDFQSSVIPGYGAYDRFARYSDYAEMESYPILSKALDIVADEVTQKDEDGDIIKVSSEHKEIKNVLTELFQDILHLDGKEIFKLVRNLCKYGDVFHLIDATEENGVVNLIPMPANEVEREEGFDKEEPTAVRFRWATRNNVEIPNAFVAHFRLDGNDLFRPYGQSFLEAARRPWRQLVLLEDAMMVYRITRAPERRVYYLDIMGVPPEATEEVVNEFNKTIKKNKVVNEQGKIDLRYGATMSMEEDYVIPVRGQDSGTRIDTLPGGQNASDIEDIEFIKKNLFASLGIPKAFLTFDEDVGAKAILTHEDIRFARTVARIQEAIINELVKIGMIHLYLKGYRGKDLVNFEIKMTNPSTVAEMQKSELWRARMELVQQAGEGVFDTTFIYKNFLHLTDEAIDMVRKGQIMDKIFQSKLMQIEGAAGLGMDQMGMGMGGMGGMGMGSPFGGGGGMGFGGGMPDLGGADPNMVGMPPMPMESFNPAANITQTFDPTKRKDLSRRNSDERVGDLRGQPEDEIISTEDVSDSTRDALDTEGIRRDVTSPMGIDETIKYTHSLLERYRKHAKYVEARLIDKVFYKEMPWFRPASVRASSCSSVNESLLVETWGPDAGKQGSGDVLIESTKQMLKEQIDSASQNVSKIEVDSESILDESMFDYQSRLHKILNSLSSPD